jgi:hypothetical protein
MLGLLGGGCGGISATRSVSPLDFLLPGGGGLFHMRATPPAVGPSTNALLAAVEAKPRAVVAP